MKKFVLCKFNGTELSHNVFDTYEKANDLMKTDFAEEIKGFAKYSIDIDDEQLVSDNSIAYIVSEYNDVIVWQILEINHNHALIAFDGSGYAEEMFFEVVSESDNRNIILKEYVKDMVDNGITEDDEWGWITDIETHGEFIVDIEDKTMDNANNDGYLSIFRINDGVQESMRFTSYEYAQKNMFEMIDKAMASKEYQNPKSYVFGDRACVSTDLYDMHWFIIKIPKNIVC